jgi:hypothetical protein
MRMLRCICAVTKMDNIRKKGMKPITCATISLSVFVAQVTEKFKENPVCIDV